MNDKEHDELLIRLDERMNNILQELTEYRSNQNIYRQEVREAFDKIFERQEEQTDYIANCVGDIKSHETSLNLFKWMGGVFVTAFLTFAGFFIEHLVKH